MYVCMYVCREGRRNWIEKAMEETGYNVLVADGSTMIVYMRLLLKLLYKRKRRRPPSYIAALNVLTMTITGQFNPRIYIFWCINSKIV